MGLSRGEWIAIGACVVAGVALLVAVLAWWKLRAVRASFEGAARAHLRRPHAHVLDVRADGEREVRRQGPGRGRPDRDVLAGLQAEHGVVRERLAAEPFAHPTLVAMLSELGTSVFVFSESQLDPLPVTGWSPVVPHRTAVSLPAADRS